jgi:hypothetical protein
MSGNMLSSLARQPANGDPMSNSSLGILSIGAAAALLSACVVQERVYAPPPRPYQPPVYVAPAYTAPAATFEVRVSEAPPPLPDYEQPPCPEVGYLWTPGYWAYGPQGYFWVPGTWVSPPQVGVLWTPGYWGWSSGVYVFHAGYWGPHVGFYGGVNYGGGYVGVGFAGARWVNNTVAYNASVTNVNTTIVHNTYNETVVNNVTVNKVSYNGGAGGVPAAPTPQEQMAARESHVPPTPMQTQHIQQAGQNRALLAAVNQGRPAIAATPRPGAFNAANVVPARAAGYTAPLSAAARGTAAPQAAAAAHPQAAGGYPGAPAGQHPWAAPVARPQTAGAPPPAAKKPPAKAVAGTTKHEQREPHEPR